MVWPDFNSLERILEALSVSSSVNGGNEENSTKEKRPGERFDRSREAKRQPYRECTASTSPCLSILSGWLQELSGSSNSSDCNLSWNYYATASLE